MTSIILLKLLKKLYAKSVGGFQLPALIREEDPDIISEIIYNYLINDSPCMISRFGSTELLNIVNYLGIKKGKQPILNYIKGEALDWWWNSSNINQLVEWSGFFPKDIKAVEEFCQLTLNCATQIDVLGSWLPNEYYVNDYVKNSVKVWLIFLDPFWAKSPWTLALKGKKVLVIHPFAELIKEQYYNKRTLLFKNNDILPEFHLKTIKAIQSLGGDCSLYSTWFKALDSMKKQIDQCDFDICLLGCGAYGLPLASHIKSIGKKAIHIGGSLQLLFGIIGKRWENPQYAIKAKAICPQLDYPSLVNEHWVRPGINNKPRNSQSVENGCYW